MSDKAPSSLFTKLAEVMGEVGHVQKRGYNDFHKYNYVTEADLLDAVRDKLSSRGIVVLPSVKEVKERTIATKKGESTISTVLVDYTFIDGSTGETHTLSMVGQGEDAADKGLYKALTGASKYFVMKAFLIPTGDDPEGDKKTDERTAERVAPPKVLSAESVGKVLKAFEEAGVDSEQFDLYLSAVGLEAPEKMTADHAKALKGLLDKHVAPVAA